MTDIMFPVTGPLLCLLGDVHQWSWRPGAPLHRTVQLPADRHPGWRTQAGPAGPVRVCVHKASLYLYIDQRFHFAACLAISRPYRCLEPAKSLLVFFYNDNELVDSIPDERRLRTFSEMPWRPDWGCTSPTLTHGPRCAESVTHRDRQCCQDTNWPRSDPLTLRARPQAMSILLLPHNIPDSLKHLSNLMDDIWYYAGDRSTDVSGSHRPRSPPSTTHTFLSPFHHHPRILRPATTQVTLSHRIRLFIPNWKCVKNVQVESYCCKWKWLFSFFFVYFISLSVVIYSEHVILCPYSFHSRWTGTLNGLHWQVSTTPQSWWCFRTRLQTFRIPGPFLPTAFRM